MEFLEELKGLANRIGALHGGVGELPAGSMRDTMRDAHALLAEVQWLHVALTAHFTRLGAFRSDGATDTAAWLRSSGFSGRSASTVADAARVTGAVPSVRDAVERGVLGVEHAALLARLGDRIAAGLVEPSVIEPLLSASAGISPDAFRRQALAVELQVSGDDGVGRRDRSRVNEHTTDDGMGVLRSQLDPERHAIVRNALDEIVMAGWRAAKADGRPTTLELPKLRADALVEMARRSLHGTSAPSGSVRGRRGTPEVIVIVDYDTLRTGELRPDSVCRLSDGTPIPGETARRIACDAGIIPVVLGGHSQPLDVGDKSRLATPAQWAALRVRTKTCEFYGCGTLADWTKAHHLAPWADTRETNLENLVLVCERHHHMIHEGRWRLARIDGVTYTKRPSGAFHGPAPPQSVAA